MRSTDGRSERLPSRCSSSRASVADPLHRPSRYAFGVGELIFHPLKDWIWKGPFTEQIRMFLFRSPFVALPPRRRPQSLSSLTQPFSSLPIHYKFSSMAYCFSYLAIAVSANSPRARRLGSGWF